MLAPLKLFDGSAAAPGLTFGQATQTGLYRTPAGGIAIVVAGSVVATFSSVGLIGLPVGTPFPVLVDTLPDLCLWADGRNVSRSVYSALFARLGTSYGPGDGSTTFTIPDLRGEVLSGRDNTGGGDAGRLIGVPFHFGNRVTTGSTAGLGMVTLALSNMPSHNHPGGVTDVLGLHQHIVNVPSPTTPVTFAASASSISTATVYPSTPYATEAAGAHGHNVSLPLQGDGAAHLNVQPTFLVNWAIYAGA